MTKKIKFSAFISVLMLVSLSQFSHAGLIIDATDNNTLATAQDLNSLFSSTPAIPGFEPITFGLDWVSIVAAAGADIDNGNGFNDYFSFTVNAGATAYFDYDNTRVISNGIPSTDPVSEMFDAVGNSIGFDGAGWGGATVGFINLPSSDNQAFLSYTFANAGTYTFGTTGSCDWGCAGQTQGDAYTLNIAVAGRSSTVPEPTTIAIFALALFGMAIRKVKFSK